MRFIKLNILNVLKNFLKKRLHNQVKNKYLHANSKKDTLFIRGADNLIFSFQVLLQMIENLSFIRN